jgi:hypothetical protein
VYEARSHVERIPQAEEVLEVCAEKNVGLRRCKVHEAAENSTTRSFMIRNPSHILFWMSNTRMLWADDVSLMRSREMQTGV